MKKLLFLILIFTAQIDLIATWTCHCKGAGDGYLFWVANGNSEDCLSCPGNPHGYKPKYYLTLAEYLGDSATTEETDYDS